MSLLMMKTTECRVGVVGLFNAGKTVFLTSLINHLENHDPDRFPFGKRDTTIRKFTREPVDRGWSAFNYAGFRDALVHSGRWPEKTKDRSQYVCRFERSDWRISDCLLKLYDLPGERLADAAMLTRNYAEWSDAILAHIENDTPYRNSCAPFLKLLQSDALEMELVPAYKLALAHLILQYKPLISPSTFLLDLQGKAAKPEAAESLAANRIAGLDAQREFVPLSATFREANPNLAALFAQRYEEYREQVAVPFLEALRSCHSLIVLVDIPMLLSAGVGMYDDNRQILRDLFDVLRPGENALKTVGRHLANVFLPHDLRPGWIHRMAFVAPKMDLVHPLDRDNMGMLLKRLVGKLAENRDGLKHEYFNCASVVSTKMLAGSGNERTLVGVPYRDLSGKRIAPGSQQRFTVPAIPHDWPASWQPGEYVFPEVYPSVPTRKDCPPEQINMQAIFDWVVV